MALITQLSTGDVNDGH